MVGAGAQSSGTDSKKRKQGCIEGAAPVPNKVAAKEADELNKSKPGEEDTGCVQSGAQDADGVCAAPAPTEAAAGAGTADVDVANMPEEADALGCIEGGNDSCDSDGALV